MPAGYVYRTNKDEYAIAYHHEQHHKFVDKKKVLIHLYSDRLCTKSIQKDPVLKSADKLTMIGFAD